MLQSRCRKWPLYRREGDLGTEVQFGDGSFVVFGGMGLGKLEITQEWRIFPAPRLHGERISTPAAVSLEKSACQAHLSVVYIAKYNSDTGKNQSHWFKRKKKGKKKCLSVPGDAIRLSGSAALHLHGRESCSLGNLREDALLPRQAVASSLPGKCNNNCFSR